MRISRKKVDKRSRVQPMHTRVEPDRARPRAVPIEFTPYDVARVLSSTRPSGHMALAMAQWQKDVLEIARALPEMAREPFLLSCNWYPRHPSPLSKES